MVVGAWVGDVKSALRTNGHYSRVVSDLDEL